MHRISYWGVLACIIYGNTAFAQDMLVANYSVTIAKDKLSFVEKTIKEANTPEGRALISAAAAGAGVDPNTVSVAMAALAAAKGKTEGEAYYRNITSPKGYTICTAKPHGLKSYNGVESHGDSTFNSTIVRNKDFDGLSMYMVVPQKASTDTRVSSNFYLTFVSKTKDFVSKYPKCQKTGWHPWLSRNNSTRLNVKPQN